ncbi:MAG: alanine--tRNA ligase [Candidatus Nanopelagicales bacterium]
MDSAEIRRRFLAFFEEREHAVVPSASLILDDPTLLFVNAGMVPFKPYFLAEATPPWQRATSVQKCVRTLDIEEVGKTTRHASFFQMCGNFSFGDYFKAQAIPFAWELLTKPIADGGFALDKERLWVTVYEDDDESIDIWLKETEVPAERIQRRGMADNFWSMGVPGPCGPCSEIYYDRGPEHGVEGGPIADEDRYMEIWNLVFMESERGEGTGKDNFEIIRSLPAKNIDTGAGLERLAAVLQNVDNIYEIDTTKIILDEASAITKVKYGSSEESDVALRVVADHARTAAFMIADGVTPGNEGRGYVLRRIVRRVVLKMRVLGATEPVMRELIDAVVRAMGPQYSELVDDHDRIATIAANEEKSFLETLRSGTQIFNSAVEEQKSNSSKILPGAKAFQLHDTYGFPIDLTLELAEEAGLEVDQAGFQELMADQRHRAKEDAQNRKASLADLTVFRDIFDANGSTDWLAYEGLDTQAKVLAIVRDGEPVPSLANGEIGTVILDRTTFYAESGGQHADAGHLVGDGVAVEVLDVQRPVKGLVAHKVRVTNGELVLEDSVEAKVDPSWRRDARQAHSGTHVVHAALREVLGPSATQSGSFNRPGYLRLDFSWGQALSPQARLDVEEVSNRAVRDDLPVAVRYMSLEEARQEGALALFGETYGDEVRVVDIGGPWSRELCGGTHVDSSSQIGPLAITSEASVGSGSRRLEAVVGLSAYDYLARERDMVGQLTDILATKPEELVERVSGMVTRLKDAEREVDKLKAEKVTANMSNLIGGHTEVGDARIWTFTLPQDLSAKELRGIVQRAQGMARSDIPVAFVGAAVDGDKVSVVAAANDLAQQRGASANDLLRATLAEVDGKGGGKADIAQGGGSNSQGLERGFEAAVSALKSALGA